MLKKTMYQEHRHLETIRCLLQDYFHGELQPHHDQHRRCLDYHTKLEFGVPTIIVVKYTNLEYHSSMKNTYFHIV